jgi:hypothetical protein
MVGYQRIVVTVAEKIGKTHLTYAQGAAAEVVAAFTIGPADVAQMPVSTTHVLSSGVAGTMWANRSGIQGQTVRKIGLAWVLTLPAAVVLSAGLFCVGGLVIPAAGPRTAAALRRPTGAHPEPAGVRSPLLPVSWGPPQPAAGGHGLAAGTPRVRRRGPRFGRAEGAYEDVVAAPGDRK